MDIKVGDNVVVKDNRHFFELVKTGDLGYIKAVNEEWITVVINGRGLNFQPYYFTVDYFTKVDMVVRQGYKDPEYIREIRARLKVLQATHRFHKAWFRFRDKIGNTTISDCHIESRKELNYIYTILRQHNEMKRMYARLR